jgi:guanylate kinase
MIVPPSFDEWQRRIAGRGVMSPQEYDRRLETAYKIFDDGLKQTYYQFVISENVEQSAAIIKAIVNGGHNPHQDRGRTLVSDLHTHLKETLRK